MTTFNSIIPDGVKSKKCKACGKEKPLSSFGTFMDRAKHRKIYHYGTCRSCMNARDIAAPPNDGLAGTSFGRRGDDE